MGIELIASLHMLSPESEERQAAEKDSWNSLSKQAHLDSHDVFPSHKSTMLGTLRHQEQHESEDGRECSQAGISLDGDRAQCPGMNEHCKDSCQSILWTDRLAGSSLSLIIMV